VESLNRSLRKIINVRGGFLDEEAALMLPFLGLRQAANAEAVECFPKVANRHRPSLGSAERMLAMERTTPTFYKDGRGRARTFPIECAAPANPYCYLTPLNPSSGIYFQRAQASRGHLHCSARLSQSCAIFFYSMAA